MPEPALVLEGVTLRLPERPSRGRAARALMKLSQAVGVGTEAAPAGRELLENVNLTLNSGQIAVLIGEEGCGKTALLMIAAGLIHPTAGALRVQGRAESLIHPRDGWHTRLTGRENIVLRGVAQGLPVSEARRRCESIAEFADVGAWLDRPAHEIPDVVLARLAFGVMAFLDAQLLLWDDVLERSDPTFRQKCLALIPSLLDRGKAILLATHDLAKARETSPRAVWIEEGRVRADGETAAVVDSYLGPRVIVAPPDPAGVFAEGVVRLAAVELLDRAGAPASVYLPGDPITVAIELELARRIEAPYFLVSIAGASGPIAAASMFNDGARPPFIDGRYRLTCTFDEIVLAPRQRFTIRFALYAADGTTTLYPKQVIASFITGGSAASCHFDGELAEGRIVGGPPVLADYTWGMPGGIEKTWSFKTSVPPTER